MFQLCFYSTHFSLLLSSFSPARAPYPLFTLVFQKQHMQKHQTERGFQTLLQLLGKPMQNFGTKIQIF